MIKIMKYGEVSKDEIFARVEPTFDVTDIVTDIIKNVSENGDKALFEYCEKFDKAVLTSLEVTEEEIEEAKNAVKILGGNIKKIDKYELLEEGQRTIIEIEKISLTAEKYPRGNGKERKNPL